jgi:histidine triad (HIT) family protein
MATIFTKIINGDIPCYKIVEDDNFIAFLDINPWQKGHTLVVPKQEVDYIFKNSDEVLSTILLFAKKVATALEKTVDCSRISLMVLGMEVPHTHIHLIPIKEEKDILSFGKGKIKFSNEEFIELTEKIRNNL